MRTEELKIEGMNCQHCVMHVRKELSRIEGLKIDNVEIGSAKVEYDENKVTRKDLADAIEEAGYSLV
jgi:copper chaperone